MELSEIAEGTGGFVIRNAATANGIAVSGAGYVNDDGYADFIIGAPSASKAYIVFGKADTVPVNLSALASNGFVINGSAGARFGFAVSNAGDINQDGLDDVVVGAPYATVNGQANTGEAYVVLGKNDTSPVDASDIALTHGGGFVIRGVDEDDHAGLSVSDAGIDRFFWS